VRERAKAIHLELEQKVWIIEGHAEQRELCRIEARQRHKSLMAGRGNQRETSCRSHALVLEFLAMKLKMIPYRLRCYLQCWIKLPWVSRENALDFAFSSPIRPGQVRAEISALLDILRSANPKTAMEIGTWMGGTLFLFSRNVSEDATIISLDMPSGDYGGGYPAFLIPFYKSFRRKGQRIRLLRRDSHSSETLNGVKSFLAGRSLDFLFIDGDHTYDGVRKDFEMYSPLVRKGGIVAFHDIATHPSEIGSEVDRFWSEIKSLHRHQEIVSDPQQGWAGIGVLYI